MAEMQLIINTDDPEELAAIAEAIRGVLGEPEDTTAAVAAQATAAPRGARGGRRRSASDATAAASPPAGTSAPAQLSAPTAVSAPVSLPVATIAPAASVDPLAGMGAPAVAPPSFEQLSVLVQQSIAKFGNAAKAIELAQANGSTGDLASLPEANRGNFYAQLQAAMA